LTTPVTPLSDALPPRGARGFDVEAARAAAEHQRRLLKPPGSLGRLEQVAIWLAGCQGRAIPLPISPAHVVFLADHGVAAAGVSAYPASVTTAMRDCFARGLAAVSVQARLLGVPLTIVDVGCAGDPAVPVGVVDRRIRRGTADLSRGPAMTVAEAERALDVGAALARDCVARGATLLSAGEMGIGNTTSAACIAVALTRLDVALAVGPGTGLDAAGIARKRDAVGAAVSRLAGRHEPVELLAEVGGFEIAAMAGFYLQAARLQVPVLLDGYISGAAALVAVAFGDDVAPWLCASHRSAEPGHGAVLAALALEPLLALDLRLGEGTGALAALPLLHQAVALHAGMGTIDAALGAG